MRDLESRMDTIFGDAFRNAGDWFNRSTLASSVDLREQKDKYVARVYLPHFDTSKAQVNVDNGVLHIVANAEGTGNDVNRAEHYEQSISLPQSVESGNVQVQRKPDLLVITVPKQTASQQGGTSSAGTSSQSTAREWENSMANEFARMNEAMDRALHETFPDSFAMAPLASRLESAVKMDEQKDKYVIHFYLPQKNVSDVRVNFDNGQLYLRAKEGTGAGGETKTGTGAAGKDASEQAGGVKVTGEYTAAITVPGPVNEDEMKVDRQANAVVVTLPKAEFGSAENQTSSSASASRP